MTDPCPACAKCFNPDSVKVTVESADSPRHPHKPDDAVPPGRTIQEWMELDGMGRHELTGRLGIPDDRMDGLLDGRAAITRDLAIKLQKIFGPVVKYWLNLEANYRAQLAQLAEAEA